MRKLIKKLALALFRGRYAPKSFSKWLVLLFDCCLFFASFWVYVFIKYIYHVDNLSVIKSVIYYETFHLIPVFVFFLINAFIFGSYQGLVRYSGFSDIKKIAYVSIGTFVLAFMVKTMAVGLFPLDFIHKWFVSHTEVAFLSMLVFVTMTLSRLIIRRIYNENISHKQEPINTVIYGAGDAGMITQNALERDTSTCYNIVAFIGERGSGKTSCLKSVYKALPEHEFSSDAKDKIIFNTSLPTIDPSYLDEQSNILEIVIAHLFKIFKQLVNTNAQTLGEDKLEKKRQLVKRFQEVKDALDCLNSNRKENKYHNDSIEELSKLAAGSNLREKMEKYQQ